MDFKSKALVMTVIVALAGGMAAPALARVTERVEGMIAENSPLRVNDNDLWLQIGYPLVLGIQYDKFATSHIVIGGGVGSYLNGTSVDLAIKLLMQTGKFSPFITVGPVLYFSHPDQNIFALYGTAGLQYLFADGWGLSLGATYVHGITESTQPFSYPWVNDEIQQVSAQFGFHWNY